jgi:hypothetical protein
MSEAQTLATSLLSFWTRAAEDEKRRGFFD